MTRVEHDQSWSEQLAGYAIGALESGETEAVERHVSECERCSRELRWLQPAVDLLPASVDQLPAPKRVRRRLMKAVRAEARRERRRGLSLLPGRPSLGLAGALAGVLVAAVLAGYAGRGIQGEPSSTIAVKPVPGQLADARVKLIRRGSTAVLVAQQLPPRPGGDVYQAWLRQGSVIEPSSVFVPDRNGSASVAISGDVASADEVMVTREPRGGSEKPGSAPILRAPLSDS